MRRWSDEDIDDLDDLDDADGKSSFLLNLFTLFLWLENGFH